MTKTDAVYRTLIFFAATLLLMTLGYGLTLILSKLTGVPVVTLLCAFAYMSIIVRFYVAYCNYLEDGKEPKPGCSGGCGKCKERQ